MPSRTTEKLAPVVKISLNDKTVGFILRTEVLGISHLKFWLS